MTDIRKLTDADWERVFVEATLLVEKRKMPQRLRDDCVAEGIRRVFEEGDRPAEDRGVTATETLAEHVVDVGYAHVRNAERMERKHRDKPTIATVQVLKDETVSTPLERLQSEEALRKLEQALADDAEASRVLRAFVNGAVTRREQARECRGMTLNDVDNAWKRIDRHIEAIGAESRADLAKKEKQVS